MTSMARFDSNTGVSLRIAVKSSFSVSVHSLTHVQHIFQLHQPILREVPIRARASAVYAGDGATTTE